MVPSVTSCCCAPPSDQDEKDALPCGDGAEMVTVAPCTSLTATGAVALVPP